MTKENSKTNLADRSHRAGFPPVSNSSYKFLQKISSKTFARFQIKTAAPHDKDTLFVQSHEIQTNKKKKKPNLNTFQRRWYLLPNGPSTNTVGEKIVNKRKKMLAIISSPSPAVHLGMFRLSASHGGWHRPEYTGAAERRNGHWRKTPGWWDHVAHGSHRPMQAVIGVCSEIKCANVESLGAAIFHVSIANLVSGMLHFQRK